MILYRIAEIAYFVIAILSFREVYLSWSSDPNRAYLMLFFGIVASGMFIFRRYYRKKFQKRQEKPQ